MSEDYGVSWHDASDADAWQAVATNANGRKVIAACNTGNIFLASNLTSAPSAAPSRAPTPVPTSADACPEHNWGVGLHGECFPCPAGRYTVDGTGGWEKEHCVNCTAGRYNANADGEGCPLCPRGTFSATDDAAMGPNCTSCALGTTSARGQTNCADAGVCS